MLKTIWITFTATAGALALAANLLLNSTLSMFGLTVTSVDALTKLQASHEVVQKMKSRQLRKHKQITKRFVKRSGRRVASTALAAATVGTVAVAAVMTSMEISNYCDQKRTLQEDANILYGTDIEFDFEQCIQESTDDAKAIIDEATDNMATKVSDAIRSTAHYGSRVWSDIKAATNNAIDYSATAFTSLWNSATSRFTE